MRVNFSPIVLFMFIAGFFTSTSVAQNEHSTQKEDWQILRFEEGDQQIVKVKASFDYGPHLDWSDYSNFKNDIYKLKFEVTDKAILEYLARALTRGVHRTPEIGKEVIGQVTTGLIEIENSKGETIKIGISNDGFILNGTEPYERNLFHSWGLTRALEVGGGFAFHRENFESLSGQYLYLDDKNAFEKMIR